MNKAREALAQSDIDEAVADERARCAWLCEQLAECWEAGAAKLRKDGSYTTRALFPLFKKVTYVRPNWLKAAKSIEAAAHGLRTVARGIREGWDSPDRPAVDDFLSAAWRARMAREIVAEEQEAIRRAEAVHGVRFFAGSTEPRWPCRGADKPHSVSGVATAIWPCDPASKDKGA